MKIKAKRTVEPVSSVGSSCMGRRCAPDRFWAATHDTPDHRQDPSSSQQPPMLDYSAAVMPGCHAGSAGPLRRQPMPCHLLTQQCTPLAGHSLACSASWQP